MNKREEAKSLFHGVDKLNCAQAILKTFQKECDVSDEMIADYKAFGGGRAEGGVCGAIYAAMNLADDKHKADMEAKFTEAATYMGCQDIKKSQSLSCPDCVAEAAQILHELQ